MEYTECLELGIKGEKYGDVNWRNTFAKRKEVVKK